MADIGAPYITASEINSQAGDPNLSGAAVNFDPTVKAPLQPIQDTFNRVDAENFQKQEQLQRQKHDILTRQMEMDHQDKVLKYQQSLQERQKLFDFFNKNPGVSSANLKDESGNDMSIPFLPKDQQEIDKNNDELRKKAFSDIPGFFYGPEFPKDNQELNTKKRNASIKAIYSTQAKQLLQNASDPRERQRIGDYINDLEDHPLTDIPHPFVKLPTTTALVDTSKYKDPKTLESFDEGEGVPNSEYVNILNTTDPKVLSEGFKRLNFFKSQPQGQDAQQYTEFQNLANKIAKQRGLPQVDLGGSLTQDNKVIFPDNTYRGEQVAARKLAYATELINNGYLRNPDEEDAQKLRKLKAETNNVYAETEKNLAEAAIKRKELAEGKSKPITPEEKQILEASKNTIRRAWEIFNPEKYEHKHGIPIESETKVTKTHWFKPDEKEEWYKSIGGVDIGGALKAEGMNPTDYKVFPAPAGVEEGVGKQRVGIGKNAQNQPTGKEFKTGENEKVDRAFTLYNPTTREVKVAFFKNTPHTVDDETKMIPQLVNIVNGRDYITHAPNAKYQWGIHGGKEVNNLNFETEQNQNLWDAIQQPGQQGAPAAPSKTKTLNGVTYEQVNGKWYKVQ